MPCFDLKNETEANGVKPMTQSPFLGPPKGVRNLCLDAAFGAR